MPVSVLKLFPFQCKSSVNHTCDICHLSKQVRNPFANSESCSSNVFDLVHMDLWGPYRIKTHGSCSYFLTINVDDMSRAAWVFLLPDKISVSRIISDFLNYVINQFKTSVKVVRSDNGTEFVNQTVSKLFAQNGIVHQTTCAYSPQQNGIVERRHRHLMNVARALRFQSNVPLTLWGDCVLTACYLINRTPTHVLQGKSPYEVLFNSKPDYSRLRIFGCLCYATTVPQPSDKFAARGIKGVFLRYPYAKKGIKS